MVFHLSARDVLVEDNVLYDNGRGILVGGIRVNAPPTNITLLRNRIYKNVIATTEDGVGIRVDTSTKVKVLHNTIHGIAEAAGLLIGRGDTGNSDQVEVKNNIVSDVGGRSP